jgi:hypothetical protein
MGLGTSLILFAAGAILRFAVTATTSGVNLQTVGLILMIIGAVGFFVSLLWMMAASDRRAGTAPVRRDTPAGDEPRY